MPHSWHGGLACSIRAVRSMASLGGAVVAAERDVSSDVQGDAHLAVGRLGDARGDGARPGWRVDDAALEVGSDEFADVRAERQAALGGEFAGTLMVEGPQMNVLAHRLGGLMRA